MRHFPREPSATDSYYRDKGFGLRKYLLNTEADVEKVGPSITSTTKTLNQIHTACADSTVLPCIVFSGI